MKPKHTPGPWTIDVLDKTTNIEAKYQTIATDVSNCDADLIAAAPEMLASLRWAEKMICASLSIEDQKLSVGLRNLRRLLNKIQG